MLSGKAAPIEALAAAHRAVTTSVEMVHGTRPSLCCDLVALALSRRRRPKLPRQHKVVTASVEWCTERVLLSAVIPSPELLHLDLASDVLELAELQVAKRCVVQEHKFL